MYAFQYTHASFTTEGVTRVIDFQNGVNFGIAFTIIVVPLNGGVMAGMTGFWGTFCSTGRFSAGDEQTLVSQAGAAAIFFSSSC